MTEDARLQDIQRVLERIGYYADADTLRDVAQEIEALRAQVQDQALHLISAHAQAEEAHADAQSKQAEIDRLMLEFCPDEMDAKQTASWAEHQQAASDDIDAAIAAAMKDDHDRP